VMIPDFDLKSDFSAFELCKKHSIHTFSELCEFVQHVPYKRISNTSDYSLILSENRGTCSSKHGLLTQALEHHQKNEVELIVGIYLMNSETNPQVTSILKEYQLEKIPEAHCYLRYNGKRYDFTSKHINIEKIEPFLVREQRCESQQLVNWKPMIHRHFMEAWIKRNAIPYSLVELWEIREKCINALEA
jgi:hypothetical protein